MTKAKKPLLPDSGTLREIAAWAIRVAKLAGDYGDVIDPDRTWGAEGGSEDAIHFMRHLDALARAAQNLHYSLSSYLERASETD